MENGNTAYPHDGEHLKPETVPYEGHNADTGKWEEIKDVFVPPGKDAHGPVKDFAYIGKQPTYLDPRKDLLTGTTHGLKTLMHHVPLSCRGPYKLDGPSSAQLGERLHQSGYALCNGWVAPDKRLKDNDGPPRQCRAKAINRSGFCSRHGGMLHPLDRKRIDWDSASRELKWKYGKLPVSDLDDEELSRGQIRKADGTWTKAFSVSSEIHDEMVRKLFERSDQLLRENLIEAVKTFAEIASGTAYEPADRLRAAEFIFTRLRGKVPTEIILSQEKPFEAVLTHVLQGGSRAESRARRAIEMADGEDAIDAEFEEEVELEDAAPQGNWQNPSGASNSDVASQNVSNTSVLGRVDLYQLDGNDGCEDLPIRADWEPKPVVSVGAAGKTYTEPPVDMEQRARYEKEKARSIAQAEQARQKFIDDAKAFKKKMNKERAKRYAAKAQGFTSLPVAYNAQLVEYEDEPGEVYMVFSLPVAPMV